MYLPRRYPNDTVNGWALMSVVYLALVFVSGCQNPDTCVIVSETDEEAYLQIGGPFDLLKHDEGPGQEPRKMTEAIDQLVRQQMCLQEVAGLGLGIVWQGNLVYVKGYGFARGWNDADKIAVSVHGQSTRFRWASISKTVTGLAAMIASQEVDGQGNQAFDLNASILQAWDYRGCKNDGITDCNLYLPPWYFEGWFEDMEDEDWDPPLTVKFLPIDAQHKITPRSLLANLAGFMHYNEGNPNWASGKPPEAEKEANHENGFIWAFPYLTGLPLIDKPTARYNYSSFGFNVAGGALENALSKYGYSYWTYVKSRIANKTEPSPTMFFHPDDIYSDVYNAAPYFTAQNRAEGYNKDSDSGVVSATNKLAGVQYKLPSGGFVSTTADLALYAEGLQNYRFLSMSKSDELWTPQKSIVEGQSAPNPTTGYALGFNIGTQSGERMVYHNGGQENAASRLVIFPDGLDPSVGKLGIVIMSNAQHMNKSAFTDAIEALLRNPVIPLGKAGVIIGDDQLGPFPPSVQLPRQIETLYPSVEFARIDNALVSGQYATSSFVLPIDETDPNYVFDQRTRVDGDPLPKEDDRDLLDNESRNQLPEPRAWTPDGDPCDPYTETSFSVK